MAEPDPTRDRVERATAAATVVARREGLKVDAPRVLSAGANVVVQLAPSPVVAKVASLTALVRPDVAAFFARDLEVAKFLEQSGVPVVGPSAELPIEVTHHDGQVITFWTYVDHERGARPDTATTAALLDDLHSVLAGMKVDFPRLAPVNDIAQYLLSSELAPQPLERLRRAYDRLGDPPRLTEEQVVHGDSHPGNLLSTPGGWLWSDFEDTCVAPRAWDLAALIGSRHVDRQQAVDRLGSPGAEWLELRELHKTVWYLIYARDMPQHRERAAELLARW